MARTITIPGGEAVMFDQQNELGPRRRREVEVVSGMLGRRLEQVMKAQRIFVDGELVEERDATKPDGSPVFVGDVDLTEKQMRLLMRISDVTTWALLKSWTLPIPVPADPESFMDECPGDVFEVLRERAAVINADMGEQGDPFTVDVLPDEPGVELDTSSPTSA